MSAATPSGLTRGNLLARNVVLNAGGLLLPALAALASVPLLIRGLGDDRFGVLALAWTALGYFSLFDFGIGRAVTHAVASRVAAGSERQREIGTVIWTSLAALLPVGIAAGAAVYLGASGIAGLLRLPADLRMEGESAFRILALAIPFATITASLRGALEARQYFGAVNALRVPHGLWTFLGPLAVLPFSRSLVSAAAVLTVGRALLCVAHFVVCARAIPAFAQERTRWNARILRSLLGTGGWMQVSNMVSPLMATLDRFVVGAVLGVGLVTYYTAPHELVTKLWLFTLAVLPVFFSAIATTAGADAERAAALFDRLLRFTVLVMFLPALVLVALAPEILRVWLGNAFVGPSSLVMQVLAIAVFVNTVGQGAFTLIQGLGRPDVTGKLHLIELPFYAVLLWFLLPRYGLLGAALAWSLRTIVDTILLLALCPVLMPRTRTTVVRVSAWMLATSAVLLAAVPLSHTPARIPVALAALPLWMVVAWRSLLTPDERQYPTRALSAALRPEQA